MKDEEMAEAKATTFADINYNEPDNYGTEKEIGYHAYYCGFLAGLKAGRPQWHKVVDGDLPKGYCLVFYKDTSGENSYSIVHPSWYIAGIKAFFENNPRIIAWCEIPTFDKE